MQFLNILIDQTGKTLLIIEDVMNAFDALDGTHAQPMTLQKALEKKVRTRRSSVMPSTLRWKLVHS
jgi:SpoU rRNA methylase family enzyme